MRKNHTSFLARIVSRIFCLAGCLLLLSTARAADIQLFGTDGRPLDDYTRQIHMAKPGDTFVFTDGKRMKIKKFLGQGNTTSVFEVSVGEEVLALRVPKLDNVDEVFHSEDDLLSFIDDTVKGYKTLNGAGIPTVKIHGSSAGQYVLVDLIDNAFTLESFLRNPHQLSYGDQISARSKLLDFARKSAPFHQIGDFRFDQVAFDKKRQEWVLLDWIASPEASYTFDPNHTSFGDNIFNQVYTAPLRDDPKQKNWAKQILNEVDREIRKERLRLNSLSCGGRFSELK